MSKEPTKQPGKGKQTKPAAGLNNKLSNGKRAYVRINPVDLEQVLDEQESAQEQYRRVLAGEDLESIHGELYRRVTAGEQTPGQTSDQGNGQAAEGELIEGEGEAEEGNPLSAEIMNLLPVNKEVGKPASKSTLSSLKKHRFLRHYISTGGRPIEACKRTGIPFTTYWGWLRYDDKFNEAYEIAQAALIPFVHDKVREWAFEGIDKPVIHKGEVTGYVKDHNALMTMFASKQIDPSYRDAGTQIGIAGSDIEISFNSPDKT